MLIKDANPIPIKKEFMLVTSGSNPRAQPSANIILPNTIANNMP